MAEPNGNIELKTGFGTIAATGTTVFVVVALALMCGIALWEHYQRRIEHENMTQLVREENALTRVKMDSLICTNRLNLFFQTMPKGKEIAWQDVPQEYWPCMPKNLLDRTIR
jgi:hypothetical protein